MYLPGGTASDGGPTPVHERAVTTALLLGAVWLAVSFVTALVLGPWLARRPMGGLRTPST